MHCKTRGITSSAYAEKNKGVTSCFWYISQVEKGAKKAPRIIWSHPGTDLTGMAARSEKIVNTCEKVNIITQIYMYLIYNETCRLI